jgi:hypothetical protein
VNAAAVTDSWFYYFSSFAQTIAAISTLLVALAIIKLQSFSNSLNAIERSCAEVFYQIDRLSDYHEISTPLLQDDWSTYFDSLANLAERCEPNFASGGPYTASSTYLAVLVGQGRRLQQRKTTLHTSLLRAFGGTLVSVGVSVLALPAAMWISRSILLFSWICSAAVLVCLLVYYLVLVRNLK